MKVAEGAVQKEGRAEERLEKHNYLPQNERKIAYMFHVDRHVIFMCPNLESKDSQTGKFKLCP